MPTPTDLTRTALVDLERRLFRAQMELGYLEKNPTRVTDTDNPERWRQVIADLEARIADVKSQRAFLQLDQHNQEEHERSLARAKQGVADLTEEIIAEIRAKKAAGTHRLPRSGHASATVNAMAA